ncbi:restriction endonuclease subunit S [Pseudomonas solani]|uniref:Restriction endonuclease subunit S n=1 Tax=Pseudomonas solani TaxID=2731552 RepID=A0ABM7L9H2_9PSED|nr:restriction endonuclease subunit S [Pseudomonas solani]BCD86219.1 restriction endonuclease subunit S [Pseudomonas solani]
MSWNIPGTWQMATLADVCYRIVDGSHNPPSGQASGKPMLSAKNIQNGKIHFDELRLLSDEDFEVENKRTSISVGDVLLTIVGALGRTAVVPEVHNEFTLQRSVAVLKPEIINSNYLRYLLDSPVAQTFFLENAKGTAQKGIYLKALGAMPAPIAPLAEQTRIAQKLDELLAQVDTLKARIDAIPTLLKRFRQSVLAAAVSGRLTEEWRVQNSIADWQTKTVGELCKLKSGIAVSADIEKAKGDFKYFKVGEMNLEGNELFLQNTDRYLARDNAPEKSLMPAGAIVFPKRGGAIATNKKRILRDASFVDLNVMGIIAPQGVEALYIYRWFETVDLAKLNTGSTIPQVNNTDIAPLIIPLPPLAEQTEIVRRVEQLFTFAGQLEGKVASAKSRIDHLTQSILAKAFRGELVPQDPNDEPASALLEHIAKSKLNKPSKSRQPRAPQSPRPSNKNNSMNKHRQDEDVLGHPYLAEHLRRLGTKATSEALFKVADLPVADFYKQLAWEVAQGLIVDLGETLEVKYEA